MENRILNKQAAGKYFFFDIYLKSAEIHRFSSVLMLEQILRRKRFGKVCPITHL